MALTLGLILPSWLEAAVKTSELFVRMNSSDARWAHLGRIMLRQQCGDSISAESSLPREASLRAARVTRSARLAIDKLRWQLQLAEAPGRRSARGRREPLDRLPALTDVPDLMHCSSLQTLGFAAGAGAPSHPCTIAHDVWFAWGSNPPAPAACVQPIHAFTDGSFDRATNTSAWSLAVRDEWLEPNFDSLPADEQQLTAAHVGGAALFGGSIICTQGIYPAELQAIARALAMFPVSVALHIHSDSRASLAAITSFEHQLNFVFLISCGMYHSQS